MATSSSTHFTDLFGSAPRPIREFLHCALQLRDLQELYTRARGTSHATLSRAVLDLLHIRIDLPAHHRERFPRTGAVVVVANHPFGLLDGLVLDAVLQELRPDVKILTNSFLWGIEELDDRCLPVDVFGGRTNLRSCRQAFQLLAEGRGIAIFPAGEVAHWRTEQRAITDPPWNDAAARFARRAEARVVPDASYTQLILWHKASERIAGSYRLAWTQDVLAASGIHGLYTSTLFRFAPAFFQALGPAVELGRSFISPEFQKDYAPLLLLWQAIGRSVAGRPEVPVLFGPVSVSADYSEASRQLIVEFLRERRFRADLAHWVAARRPFRSRLTRAAELRAVAVCLSEVEDLSARINDIEEHSGVPVLLRQYLRLGGGVAAFHLDRNFSDTLDGLLIVDLREAPPKMLAKYVGPQNFRQARESV